MPPEHPVTLMWAGVPWLVQGCHFPRVCILPHCCNIKHPPKPTSRGRPRVLQPQPRAPRDSQWSGWVEQVAPWAGYCA
jgi:hypothetical protein